MWHDNLMDMIKEKNITKQQIADRGNLPLKTVIRVIKKETQFPTIDTLDRFATALGCTLGDILAGTRAVVGNKTLAELQDEITALSAEKETIAAERDLLLAENAIFKEKSITQEKEIELLKLQVLHKEELLSVHNAYLKLQQSHQEHH